MLTFRGLMVLGALIVMITIVFIGRNKNSTTAHLSPQAGEFFHACLSKTEDVASRMECAKEWFRTQKISDFSQSLAIIHNLNNTATIVGSQCHKFEHVAVVAVLNNNGNDVESVLKACDATYSCGGGCFHSAMTEAVRIRGSSESNIKTLSDLCQNIVHKKRDILSCFHGLGHGYFEDTMELVDALKLCEKTTEDPLLQESCYSGVFRAAALPSLISGHHPSYFHHNDPIYPCREVPEKFQAACFADAGERGIEAGLSIGEVLEVCSQVPKEDWKFSCRATLYVIEVRKAITPREKQQTCRAFGQYESECFSQVASELASAPYARDILYAFCDGVSEDEQEACKRGQL